MAAIAEANAPVASAPGLFQNRPFVALFIGQTVSIIGDGFHSVALGLWVLQTTGSATAMATIMTVRMLVTILLGSLAGAIVDRVDRYKVMVAVNAVRFLITGAIAYLIYSGMHSLLPIVVLSGLLAVAGNFYGPALQASLINIVGKEQIQQATSLRQVSNTLAQVVGPLLGGAVVAFTGGWAAMSIDSVTFLFGLIMTIVGGYFPSPVRNEAAGRSSIWADMKEGLVQIRKNPIISTMVTVAPLLNFFATATFLLLPVIAVRVWQTTPTQFGAMEASFPLGFAAGAALLMAFSKKMSRRGWWIITGTFFTGLGMVLIPLMPTVTIALPVMVATGLVNALINVLFSVVLQSETPPEVQGRVFGTLNSLTGIANPLAMMLAGVLADRVSPVLLASGAGIVVLLISIGIIPWARPLRSYN